MFRFYHSKNILGGEIYGRMEHKSHDCKVGDRKMS